MKNNKNYKNVYVTVGITILTILLIMVTYAFTNYVKNNDMYNVTPTRISYSIDPNDLVTLTNVFPISSDYLVEDLSNHATVTVNIKGATSNNGVEYIVKLDQVDNMINDKAVPITYNASASNLGEMTNDYFSSRDLDKNLYQLNEIGTVYSNETIAVGYIKKGETNFNGSVTLTAFVDADRIGIYDGDGEKRPEDDYSESGAVIPDYFYKRDDENVVVFTPSEWQEINERGISFKVRVELKEGIWITND